MALLEDLPFELIRLIFSHIVDQYSGKEILSIIKSQSKYDQEDPMDFSYSRFIEGQITNENALSNFARACNSTTNYLCLAEFLGRAPFGVYTTFPRDAIRSIYELLQKWRTEPGKSAHVQNFFVYIEHHSDRIDQRPSACFVKVDDLVIEFLEEEAYQVGIDVSAVVSRNGAGMPAQFSIEDIIRTPCEADFVLAFTLAILFRRAPNIKHLALAVPAYTINWIDAIETAIASTIPDSDQHTQVAQPPTKRLLHLQSFAFKNCLRQAKSLGTGFRILSRFEEIFQFDQGSEFYMENFEIKFHAWQKPRSSIQLAYVTSVVLRDVVINLQTLKQMFERINHLSRFILTYATSNHDHKYAVASEVVEALEDHEDSLVTLCLDCGSLQDVEHRPVKSLAQFEALENLWIRAAEFHYVDDEDLDDVVEPETLGPDSDAHMPHEAVRTLPASLKRLHLIGSATLISSDLLWLAEKANVGGHLVPLPQELRLDGRFRNSGNIARGLRGSGVAVGEIVDECPTLW